MRGVCRPTLAPIRGRGVSELDVLGDVIDGEHDFATAFSPAQRQTPIRVGGGNYPTVAVLDPGLAGRDEPVV